MRARIGMLGDAMAHCGAEQARFMQAQVELRAFAGPAALMQRRQDGDGAEAAALHVGDRYARARRLAQPGPRIGKPAAGADIADIVSGLVAPGAVLAETRKRAVDEARVQCRQAGVIDAEA